MPRYLARLLTAIVVGSVLSAFYCAWHLTFFALCMFRPVVNLLAIGGVVMVPFSIAAFVKPEAANGMPFWAFLLMAIGFVGFAMGYSKVVDWFTPPGESDPFERYRRRDWL
ncbi:hypothetical protein [Mesorhizobium sp. M1A.F.Ca.IN.022.07.1.1]|uniref:hypothetical protein n=1 Tax=Mesorhizobium sp. M1A.F.Ca.IN.022.07.1.1 TaxID=2496767 RepID=UPI001FE24039|nr:hypothetical protein [Mesorhizobium sp. M1A.F.Ca.IN.022.07.1.1]